MSSSHRAGGKRPRMASAAGQQPSPPTKNNNVAAAARSPSLILTSTNNASNISSSNSHRNATTSQAAMNTNATTTTTGTIGQEETHHQTQEAASANNSSNNNDFSMLLRLSTACKKHQAWHKENPGDTFTFPCIHVENTPEKCQRELHILRRVLSTLEKEYQPNNASRNSSRNSKGTPEHVGHMCDFYRDVLAGGFCPHAPHLFQLGRGAIDSTC
jgi:hypothetical protein